MLIINQDFIYDSTWHYVVESVILDVKENVATMLATLHKIN